MKSFLLGLAIVLCCAATLTAQRSGGIQNAKTHLSGSLITGYYGGLGLHVGGTLANFAQGFPLSVRFSIGRSSIEPGDPLAARRVFINNNTNGTPEESGHLTNCRLDFANPLYLFTRSRTSFFAGPRHSRFVGEFVYVGGNEDFEVRCNQWGIGLGLDNYFAIGKSLDLLLTAGADYYFSAKLYGHDTTYFPDGQNFNGREDYKYSDADEAINQPKLKLMLMVGLNYNF